jgi:hypothetical protein
MTSRSKVKAKQDNDDVMSDLYRLKEGCKTVFKAFYLTRLEQRGEERDARGSEEFQTLWIIDKYNEQTE